MRYLQRMSRLEGLARTYWVDALLALLLIAGALELVVARNSPSDPPTDLWLSVLLLAVLVAPIFARRFWEDIKHLLRSTFAGFIGVNQLLGGRAAWPAP